MSSKWAEVLNSQGSVGILWMTEHGVGFAPNPTPDNKALVSDILLRTETLNEMTIEDEAVYEYLFSFINNEHNCLSIVSEGEPGEIETLIAAATPKTYTGEELAAALQTTGPFSITVDDDTNEVVGLSQTSDNSSPKVRQDGQWVDVADEEDPRYYGGYVLYVKPEAVELYDKLVAGDSKPTSTDFKEVLLD